MRNEWGVFWFFEEGCKSETPESDTPYRLLLQYVLNGWNQHHF